MIKIINVSSGEIVEVFSPEEIPEGWTLYNPLVSVVSEAPFLNYWIIALILLLAYLIYKAG